MHVAFQMLFKAIEELDSVAGGATVWRKRSLRMVQPSIYSKLLCQNLGQHLQDTLKPHPLLLVGCYLNPLFRGFEFVSDEKTRSEMRSKAEEMTRKLSRHFLNSPSVINGDNEEPIENISEYQDEIEMSSPNGPNYNSIGSSVIGKKRTFSLIDLADSGREQNKPLGEVSVYNLMNLAHVKEEGQRFLNDDYSVLKFWFNRKRQHSVLYAVAARVLATPFSSSASERVFSVVKSLVTENQSRPTSNILEDIIAIRSLTEQC